MVSSSAEVYNLYIDSSEPRRYEEIMGSSDHAQRLFDSKHKENIIQMMINFIEN